MPGFEDLLTGRTLVKRYRIGEVIGRGGFAAVYRADDERLGRPVAVKVMSLPARDAESRTEHHERFAREARAAASLPQHPNVVAVYDFGTDPQTGLDFLVMELLDGEDLAAHLAREGRPPLPVALRIVHDVAEGLAVGHREGLIHRDVKPGNIFLAEPRGEDRVRVCVLDFGIARLVEEDETLTHLTRGAPLSPAYASPEQTRGDARLTPATDVFSLGVVAYQLLTGEKPFRAERSADPADWLPESPIRTLDPDVPPAVAAVVDRALAYDPRARFADGGEMLRALDAAIGGGAAVAEIAPAAVVAPAPPAAEEDDRTLLAPMPAAAAPPPTPVRPAAPRRSSAPAWIALLVLLVGAAALWAVTRGRTHPRVVRVEASPESAAVTEPPPAAEPAVPDYGPPPVVVPPGVPPGAATAPSVDTATMTPAVGAVGAVPAETAGAALPAEGPPTAVDTVATPAATSPSPRPDTSAAAVDTVTTAPDSTRPPPRLLGTPAGRSAPNATPRDTSGPH
ncbi:MAG TPA: protein kinase [Longimicrobiaceae bacterium]|nr:protein kinase [Longimicrobiaceae bacterium]